jgi:hypothetical protein
MVEERFGVVPAATVPHAEGPGITIASRTRQGWTLSTRARVGGPTCYITARGFSPMRVGELIRSEGLC